MKILMIRSWNPPEHAATFVTLEREGVGATESQLLMHSRALRAMGHEVVVFGVTRDAQVQEDDIRFEGSGDVMEAGACIQAEHGDAELVFVNITDHLDMLRSWIPRATTVQVCQNGPHFQADKWIDLYAFVGDGQFAYHSVKARRYRDKFVLLPNAVPWATCYENVPSQEQKNQVIWIGGFGKQGLRRWAKAMVPIMRQRPNLCWKLCGPSYYRVPRNCLPAEISDVRLPLDKVEAVNLPLRGLALELRQSLMLLTSLGGEDGPVSYLDGHALGVPVLCGNDIIGKFATPEGTGIRSTTVSECRRAINWVLEHPYEAAQMGALGKKFVLERYTEKHQASALERIVGVHRMNRSATLPSVRRMQSDRKFAGSYWLERLEIKAASARARGRR